MAKSLEEALVELRNMSVRQLSPNCAAGCDFEDWLRDGADFSEEELAEEELAEKELAEEEVYEELTQFILVTEGISVRETTFIKETADEIFAYMCYKNDDFVMLQGIKQFDNEVYTRLRSAA